MDEWNEIYRQGKQLNEWPFSDVVSLVKRHMPDLTLMTVLELGCGTGNNAAFFEKERALYNGVDMALAGHNVHFYAKKADFTKPEAYVGGPFDLIFDRAAVTHNDTDRIKRCLELVHGALKPGGLFIGVDWFSNFHSDSAKGEYVDEFTRTNIKSGQFAGVGKVHFSTYRRLMELFVGFEVVEVQNKAVHLITPKEGITGCVGTWNIVARKHE